MADAKEVINNSQKIIQEQLLRSKLAVMEQKFYDLSDRVKFLEDSLKALPKRAKSE